MVCILQVMIRPSRFLLHIYQDSLCRTPFHTFLAAHSLRSILPFRTLLAPPHSIIPVHTFLTSPWMILSWELPTVCYRLRSLDTQLHLVLQSSSQLRLSRLRPLSQMILSTTRHSQCGLGVWGPGGRGTHSVLLTFRLLFVFVLFITLVLSYTVICYLSYYFAFIFHHFSSSTIYTWPSQ